jgi:hypothetical protein
MMVLKMKYNRIVIILAVAMLAVTSVGLVLSDDSDATMVLDQSNITSSGFKNNSSGTIVVPIENTDTYKTVTITVTASDPNDSSNIYTTTTVDVAGGETGYAYLSFQISSVGDHQVLITCTPADAFESYGSGYYNTKTVTVNVEKSIWTNWATYGAIAVIAILIAIAVIIKMRSAPAIKPDTTFTELDKEKKANQAVEPAAPSTQRRKYNSSASVNKTETKQPEPEKRASTFTDLQNQKTETKKTSPSKKDSTSEPKKIKYVSSRRK